MSLFKIVLWCFFLLFLTVFTAQNLTESFPVYLIAFRFNIPSVVGIFFFMFLGSVFVLPIAFKRKIKLKKKEKQQEEENESKKDKQNKK
jgi:uncharacterized integral membrane protein